MPSRHLILEKESPTISIPIIVFTQLPDAVEMNGIIYMGKDEQGKEIIEPCFNNEYPNAWAVYWHFKDKGVDWIQDFKTEQEAIEAKKLLENALNVLTLQATELVKVTPLESTS